MAAALIIALVGVCAGSLVVVAAQRDRNQSLQQQNEHLKRQLLRLNIRA